MLLGSTVGALVGVILMVIGTARRQHKLFMVGVVVIVGALLAAAVFGLMQPFIPNFQPIGP